MNDNKVTIIGILFFALCIGLGAGIYFLDRELKELKGQYDNLERRRTSLEQDAAGLKEQISVFNKSFERLEAYNVRATSSDISFKDQIQEKIDEHRDVITTVRSSQSTGDGRSIISMTLRGDYYSFMKILAGWRNLPTTVRVSQLSMTASKTPQTSGEVQADVVLEAIISAR